MMTARICTVFILITVSIASVVRAQPMNWPQQPVPQQSYAVTAGTMPIAQYANTSPQAYRMPAQAAFQPPATPPYYVASYSASRPVSQAQLPIAAMDSTPCHQGAPHQPYASMDRWCAPSFQGSAGYNSGCCGGGYAMPSHGMVNFACRPPVQWFGSAGVLMLNREDENHRFFSYDSNDESYQLLDSQDSNFDWSGGPELHLGCFDCCNCRGWEAVYWGLFPEDGYAYAYPSQVTGNLNGIFNFDQLDYNGQPANIYVDDAAVHRLYRETEIHNVEFNYLWGCSGGCGTGCCTDGCTSCCDSCCDPCCSSACGGRACRFQFLAGLRYLRLEDNLQFASDTSDTAFTGEVDELYYDIDTDNDLFGLQFGGKGEMPLCHSRFFLTCGGKAGVFYNDADARSTIGGAAGLATINNGPNIGVPWDISAHKDDVATIAEVQAGVAWAFYPTWRLRGDYRVIGVSGVALPTNQIYQDLRGVQDVALLSTNGDLILHGVFVGVERTY